MDAPPLKMAMPMARSRCGNHSAITLAAPGQFPASPRSQKKRARRKAAEADNRRVGHRRGTPHNDRQCKAGPRAVTVVQPPGYALAHRIGKQKNCAYPSVLLSGNSDLRAKARKQQPHAATIHVVNAGSEKNEGENVPAQSVNQTSGIARRQTATHRVVSFNLQRHIPIFGLYYPARAVIMFCVC